MGLQGDIDGMYIAQNAKFFNSNFWSPFPPWVIIAGRAIWPSWLATLANFLRQTCPVLAGETYRVTVDITITGNARNVRVSVGNDFNVWFLAPGDHHKDFELTPNAGDTVEVDVGQATGDPSTCAIDNLWVWGRPGGTTMFGNFADGAFNTVQGFRFEQTSPIGGDDTYRACNRTDGTRINIRYTP